MPRKRKQVLHSERLSTLFAAVFMLTLLIFIQPSQTGLATASFQEDPCPNDISIGQQLIPQPVERDLQTIVIEGETNEDIPLHVVGPVFAHGDGVYEAEGIFGDDLRVDPNAGTFAGTDEQLWNRWETKPIAEDGLSYVKDRAIKFWVGRADDEQYTLRVVNYFREAKEIVLGIRLLNPNGELEYHSNSFYGENSFSIPAATVVTEDDVTTCTAGEVEFEITNPLTAGPNLRLDQEGWWTLQFFLGQPVDTPIPIIDDFPENHIVETRIEVKDTGEMKLAKVLLKFVDDDIEDLDIPLIERAQRNNIEFLKKTYPIDPRRVYEYDMQITLGWLTANSSSALQLFEDPENGSQFSAGLGDVYTASGDLIINPDDESSPALTVFGPIRTSEEARNLPSDSRENWILTGILLDITAQLGQSLGNDFIVAGITAPGVIAGNSQTIVTTGATLTNEGANSFIVDSLIATPALRRDGIFAHEIGHILGLPSGVYSAREEYATNHEYQTGSSQGLYYGFKSPGFDALEYGRRVYAPGTPNFMGSSSSEQWVSKPSYKRMFQYAVAHDGFKKITTIGDFAEEFPVENKEIQFQRSPTRVNAASLRIGFVENESLLYYAKRVQIEEQQLLEDNSEGSFTLQVRNANNQVLFNGGITPSFIGVAYTEDNEGSLQETANGNMEVTIPITQDADHIVLKDTTGRELWQFPVSEEYPVISLPTTEPQTINVENENAFLEWEITDSDSEKLYHTIYYLTAEDLWLPVGPMLTSENLNETYQLQFNPSNFTPNTPYQFKIMISDGLNENEIITPTITVTDGTIQTQTLTRELPAGFSLIGLNARNASITDARSLRNASSCETSSGGWMWNGASWTLYVNGIGTNFPITTEDGIWYYCSTPSTLQYTGETLPTTATLTLQTGFNYKTLPINAPNGMRINTLMNQINAQRGVTCGTAYQFVQNFFRIHTTNLPNFNNFTIEGGEGIIIQCPAGGTTEIRAT